MFLRLRVYPYNEAVSLIRWIFHENALTFAVKCSHRFDTASCLLFFIWIKANIVYLKLMKGLDYDNKLQLDRSKYVVKPQYSASPSKYSATLAQCLWKSVHGIHYYISIGGLGIAPPSLAAIRLSPRWNKYAHKSYIVPDVDPCYCTFIFCAYCTLQVNSLTRYFISV